ncbi:MAG: flagellar protein FlgN [Planctomycetes bacterium]|nr:flagellar protein FlgN [Planctomycetota bacterium]
MDARSAADWEDSLGNLLTELASAQDELLDVLRAKRDCMAAHDVEGMSRLQPREEELCLRLERIQDQRRALIESATERGVAVDSLEELADAVDPGGAGGSGGTRERVKAAKRRTSLVQYATLTNWVLAQRSLLHLSQLIEIIATGGRSKPTYGMDRTRSSSCGVLVDREA